MDRTHIRASFVAFAFTVAIALTQFVAVAHAAPSSARIREEIASKIDAASGLYNYNVEIDARSGVVWLRGTVANEADRERVVGIAAETPGVVEIHNHLNIDNTPSPRSVALMESVQERVREVSEGVPHSITIVADGSTGRVDLSGTAPSEEVRHNIEQAVRFTPGVRHVRSAVVVTRNDNQTIATNIVRAIEDAPNTEIRDLVVHVQDGVATISGVGRTHRDMDAALAIALNADGVRDVRSNMTLDRPYQWRGEHIGAKAQLRPGEPARD